MHRWCRLCLCRRRLLQAIFGNSLPASDRQHSPNPRREIRDLKDSLTSERDRMTRMQQYDQERFRHLNVELQVGVGLGGCVSSTLSGKIRVEAPGSEAEAAAGWQRVPQAH